MLQPFRHCSFCGAEFGDVAGWPRTCAACGNTTYRNPLPVAVVLVPVDGGLLLMRRGVAPRVGELALPGGYVNYGESWQAAGAREVAEETSVVIDPATIMDFLVRSAPDSTLLIFGLAAPLLAAELPPFVPSAEASERLIARAPVTLAFPLHTDAMARFFASPMS